MSLVKIEVDHDVREMALRIASRIGKGLSDTLQDGLIYIAKAHNWSVEKDEDEVLDEGEREEVYVMWTGLSGDARKHILRLLEDERLHEELIEVKKERDSFAAQIEQLANFIMHEVPGEPSQSEGAVDAAIRLLRKYKRRARRRRVPTPQVAGFSRVRSRDLSADEWEFAFGSETREGDIAALEPPDSRGGWVFVESYAVYGTEEDWIARGALWRRRKDDDAQGTNDAK